MLFSSWLRLWCCFRSRCSSCLKSPSARTFASEKEHNLSEIVRRSPSIRIRRPALTPGAVPRTSTIALTNATLPFARRIATGWREACRKDRRLIRGLNIIDGNVTYRAVAEAFELSYVDPESLL